MALRKTLAGFLRRGLNSSRLRCYFLQQPWLQHSLPLQHACFDVVAAVAVLTKARRLRINKKYFINSSFEFSNGIRPRSVLARRTVALREIAARRRNRRTLKASSRALVVQGNRAADMCLCRKRICIAKIKEQTGGRAAAARRRARRCRTGINRTARSASQIHVHAARMFLLNDWSSVARKDGR
jgi:hypothetical protein